MIDPLLLLKLDGRFLRLLLRLKEEAKRAERE